MNSILTSDALSPPHKILPPPAPDDTQLPCSDGTMVENFHEHPQSVLLTTSITPWLKRLRPDEQFIIGQNSGIYWRQTEPPLKGCEAPDWYCVLGVPKLLHGRNRRSYVLWKEGIVPTLAIEFVSGDGSEEHDTTPYKGKFWVYEQGIRIPYYAIFDEEQATLELYELKRKRYRRVAVNERGRLAVPLLKIELGIWIDASWADVETVWMRFWDDAGNLLLTSEEQAEQERQRVKRERQRVKKERLAKEAAIQQAERLAAKLRELGIDPDA